MVKTHYNTDHEEIFRQEGGHLMKLVTDPGGHVKQASSDVFMRADLEKYAPDKDHFMVHAIAQGDGETYGENMNNDYWPKKANMERHPTFVSHGYFFREHKNRGKADAIGLIKASAYNPHLKRIELILWGNIKKAALEFETLKSGKQQDFSMSARVPFDRCNVCNNKAKRTADYCVHLKHHRRQYIPEFKKYAYAINDYPTYFDMSGVKNPALRIASYLQYKFPDSGEMRKAASEGDLVVSGAEWAEFEGVNIPDEPNEPWQFWNLRKQAALKRLAEMEDKCRYMSEHNREVIGDLVRANRQDISTASMRKAEALRPGTMFRMLSKSATVLPFDAFCSYIHNRPVEEVREDPIYKRACCHMPSLFRNMSSGICCDEGMSDLFDASPSPLSDLDEAASCDEVDQFMSEVDKKFGMRPDAQTLRITIALSKSASSEVITDKLNLADKQVKLTDLTAEDRAAKELAHAYGLYKVAAYKDASGFHDEEDMEDIAVGFVMQNYASVV